MLGRLPGIYLGGPVLTTCSFLRDLGRWYLLLEESEKPLFDEAASFLWGWTPAIPGLVAETSEEQTARLQHSLGLSNLISSMAGQIRKTNSNHQDFVGDNQGRPLDHIHRRCSRNRYTQLSGFPEILSMGEDTGGLAAKHGTRDHSYGPAHWMEWLPSDSVVFLLSGAICAILLTFLIGKLAE